MASCNTASYLFYRMIVKIMDWRFAEVLSQVSLCQQDSQYGGIDIKFLEARNQ